MGTLVKDESIATMKEIRPHSCSTRPHSCSTESAPSLQQPLVVVDYTEEMKTAASERAYSQLRKSPRALAIEIYEEFDRRANLEGAFVYTYIYPCVYAIYIYMAYTHGYIYVYTNAPSRFALRSNSS